MLAIDITAETSTKDIVIHLLAQEHPLRVVEIRGHLHHRHGRTLSYQGVRKILTELEKTNVVRRKEGMFELNPDWIIAMRELFTKMANAATRTAPKRIDAEQETRVYEFESLYAMMTYWYTVVEGWLAQQPSKPTRNCYQCAHAWEALLHLDEELQFIEKLKRRSIPTDMLITSDTPLDRSICEFYKKHKVRCTIAKSRSTFDKSLYVGTYGDLIIQAVANKDIVDELEGFFKTSKIIESFTLAKLQLIVKKRTPVRLTVIKNAHIAEQVNKSILTQTKGIKIKGENF